MLKKAFFAIAALVFAVACCKTQPAADVPSIILETDIGNDVDDALAVDLAYKFVDAGKMDLLAICINKEGSAPVEFVDILNTWYGYPEIPIGTINEGANCEDDAINYAKAVVNINNEEGKPYFARSIKDYSTLLEAPELYRKILSSRKDNSVTIVSVGFSTNLVRLLATGPDKYSKLDGKALVAKKVKNLIVMAGCFNNPDIHEYNVWKDVPAAKVIFEEWPTPVVASPFELGIQTCYPGASIENDFGWADGLHPVVEAYKSYQPMPYDRPMWDPTALLYAVEGSKWFTVSPMGKVAVEGEGSTIFTEDETGDRQYISVNPDQAKAIVDYFVEVVTSKPKNK
ncbi:MAG: nucleoside hydrolase [Bacteroidales bacterium]|nr:nucleoside hydrolase [Bacteroidales bacterium]